MTPESTCSGLAAAQRIRARGLRSKDVVAGTPAHRRRGYADTGISARSHRQQYPALLVALAHGPVEV
jgi:hypothetical protein